MDDKPEEESRDARRIRQTNENYQALGEFIITFEEMIDATRRSCMFILSRGDFYGQKLANVALHHRSMTAKPLLDIMIALYGTLLSDENVRNAKQIASTDAEAFKGVLNQINKEASDLYETRNNLLHGTWFVGYGNEHTVDFSEFLLTKFTTSKEGLRLIDGLPKSKTDLEGLSSRCRTMTDWINRVNGIWLFHGHLKITKNFKFNSASGQWEKIAASPDKSPELPA